MRSPARVRRALTALLAVALLGALLGVAGASIPALTPPAGAADTVANATLPGSLAAGRFHTCFARNGLVRCWGSNFFGQLGVGDTTTLSEGVTRDGPPVVDLGTRALAIEVTAGVDHSCALLDDGRVKCWGANHSGQLGLDDTSTRGDEPDEMGDDLPAVDLGAGRTARAVVAGAASTCALLDDGSVKCWGANSSGQLGVGDTSTRGDDPNEMGDDLPTVDLGTGRRARSISLSNAHACAVLDDATLKCWGTNSFGELGLGDTNSRGDDPNEMGDDLPTVNLGTGRTASSVSTGAGHTCVVLDDATVKCWGTNSFGGLGLGDTNSRGDDPNEMGDNLPTVDLGTGRTARLVRAGTLATCAVLDDDALRCWGGNLAGELGLGDTNSRGDDPNEMGDDLPTVNVGTGRTVREAALGLRDTCAVLDDTTLRCFGYRNGIGDATGETGDAMPVIQFGDAPRVAQVVTMYAAVCARLTDGRVACWGENSYGQLGIGSTEARGDAPGELGDETRFVDLGSGRSARAVSASAGDHVCAILDDASVKCWGMNFTGQLGLEDTDNRGDGPNEMGDNLPTVDLGTGRIAVTISVGLYHSCAVLDDASVKCWGWGNEGQLGLGDSNHRGDNPNEMGDDLPTVDLGTGRTARAIAVGGYQSCAILDDASTKCWGAGFGGQLGLGDTANRGDDPNEMGDDLPTVDLGTGRTARAIAAAMSRTCARLDNSSVKCWGDNAGGFLGLGGNATRGDDANEMGDNLPTVNLGTGRTTVALTAANSGACALLDDASVKCWGWNAYGQLGLGNTTNRGSGANQMGDNLPAVNLGTGRTARAVSAGPYNGCAALDDGSVKCWGDNTYGQVGLGDTITRGDGPGEMGDDLPAVNLVSLPTATWGASQMSPTARFVRFSLSASEPVSGLTASDLTWSGTATGCVLAVLADPPTDHVVDALCSTDGTFTLTLKGGSVTDAIGNHGPAVDVVAPTVNLSNAAPTMSWTTAAMRTQSTVLHFGFTVNEPVTSVEPGDFVVMGTAPGCSITAATTNDLLGTVDVQCGGHGTVAVKALAHTFADLQAATGPAGDTTSATVEIAPPQTITPLTPSRLLDTRSGTGGVPSARLTGTTGAMTPLVFHAAGRNGVPSSGVAAVSLNVTVVEPTTDGYASVYPCGTSPSTSSVNFVAGRTTANAVTTPLSASGDFCIIVFGDAHVIADITGWYATGEGFTAVTPARALDTRTGTGGVARARVTGTTGAMPPLVFHAAGRNGVPSSGASAVSVNLTVVEPATDGYAAIYPCGAIPNTSNVNFTAGTTTAAAAVTPLSGDGDFCVIVFGDAHVIVDVNGWYADGSGFTTVTPARLLDTRTGTGGVSRARITGTTGAMTPLTFRAAGRGGIPANGATAVSVTLTVVEPSTDGYATIYPCGAIPNTSTVNFAAGRTTANAATTPLSANGDFCIIVFGDAHVIVDVNGWYAA